MPRLRECCRQSQTEVVSKSSNKIHQTWDHLLAEPALYICFWPSPLGASVIYRWSFSLTKQEYLRVIKNIDRMGNMHRTGTNCPNPLRAFLQSRIGILTTAIFTCSPPCTASLVTEVFSAQLMALLAYSAMRPSSPSFISY